VDTDNVAAECGISRLEQDEVGCSKPHELRKAEGSNSKMRYPIEIPQKGRSFILDIDEQYRQMPRGEDVQAETIYGCSGDAGNARAQRRRNGDHCHTGEKQPDWIKPIEPFWP